jgi:hypothetical protein
MRQPRDDTDKPAILLPHAGDYFDFEGSDGVHWKIDGPDAGGRSSIVHHPIPTPGPDGPARTCGRTVDHSLI